MLSSRISQPGDSDRHLPDRVGELCEMLSRRRCRHFQCMGYERSCLGFSTGGPKTQAGAHGQVRQVYILYDEYLNVLSDQNKKSAHSKLGNNPLVKPPIFSIPNSRWSQEVPSNEPISLSGKPPPPGSFNIFDFMIDSAWRHMFKAIDIPLPNP